MDPRRMLPVLTAVAGALVVATVVVTLARPGPVPADPVLPDDVGAVGRSSPAAVLAAWDARRARAWAAADVRGLARLYVEGSRTGRADVRLLRRYRERGLRVEGLTTQVLALEVAERGPRRLVVVVTDRVVGGEVFGTEAAGGATTVALPGDRATTREVVLVRAPGGPWQVVEAREAGAQASPAASTSRTSSSTKS